LAPGAAAAARTNRLVQNATAIVSFDKAALLKSIHDSEKTTGAHHAEHTRRQIPTLSALSLPDRRWPEQRITRAPRWLSTDLRDGNQALAEPMDSARKLQFWDLLLSCGFKEIEVPFLPPRRPTSTLSAS
jgi:hypothetical protein